MNPYQTLLLIFLSIRSILAYDYEIMYGVNEALYEPERIDLSYSGAKLTLYVRLCKYSVTGKDAFLYIRMTRFCYCTSRYEDASCSYPGPTLILKGNTKISLTIVNQMSGEESTMDDTYWNHFKDMDTTNLHTHGIHVSPFEDDVLIAIEPDQEYTLSYNYGFHYPGTFWYHAHHHGSTLFQVDGGLHGAQIMTSDDIYEEELSKYEENILLFNWQYPIPKSECIPDANRGGSVSKLCPGRSSINNDPRQQLLDSSRTVDVLVSSMCDVYCQMPQFQLDSSDFVYDLQTDLNPIRISGVNKYEILYFTNGQLRPVINDLEVGIFRRLRLINSMGQFYIQFKFPDEEDECSVYLIAVDGIYIDNEYKNFDLSSSSHRNELLVSPGSRADVLIKCNEEGTYHIYASENNRQDTQQLPKLNRVSNGYKLFSIKVNEKNENRKHNINGLIMNSLPSQYPNKPVGTYIEDLYDYGETNTECPCHRPFGSFVSNPQQCIFEFEEDPDTVNGKPFDIRNSNPPLHIADSLSIIDYDEAYEFNINNDDGHVYHQHINPFQYTQHVGNNGFIALQGVWADTFGNLGSVQQVKVRTWTRDYWGLIMLHCHIIEHEDEGMMGFFHILLDDDLVCPFNNDNNEGNSGGDDDNDNDNDSDNDNDDVDEFHGGGKQVSDFDKG
eukprot:488307_1